MSRIGDELQAILDATMDVVVVFDSAATVRGRGRLPEDRAFLEKPFHQLSLLRAIRALIDQPRSRSEAR